MGAQLISTDRSCGIAVMAKASVPGRTKTRLTPPLTAIEAAAFNTAFLKDVSANLLAASRSVGIRGYMAYGPPGAQQFFVDHLPDAIGLIEVVAPQFRRLPVQGDHRTVRRRPWRRRWCSTPTVRPCRLRCLIETAEVLAQPGDRAVLGPSTDGGYYLLGIKQAHRRLFDDIDWSTERVARQTLSRAEEIGLDVHCLPAWYDVDDAASLRQLHRELFEGASLDPALSPFHAPNTAALISELSATADLRARLGLLARSAERLAS